MNIFIILYNRFLDFFKLITEEVNAPYYIVNYLLIKIILLVVVMVMVLVICLLFIIITNIALYFFGFKSRYIFKIYIVF